MYGFFVAARRKSLLTFAPVCPIQNAVSPSPEPLSKATIACGTPFARASAIARK